MTVTRLLGLFLYAALAAASCPLLASERMDRGATTVADAPTLTLFSLDGKATRFDRDDLAKLQRKTVTVNDQRLRGVWQGVPVSALLEASGTSLGKDLRGRRLAEYVLVTAVDGYRVVFAVSDFAAEFGNNQAILADTRDGQPLDAKEGPYRIVLPGEARPARWVRQVRKIEVYSAAR